MAPKSIPFEELLHQPESEWLDWKNDFAPGLVQRKGHPLWDRGRAKLLRSIVSIANSVSDD